MTRASIHFFVGNKEYAMRTWFYVPRVGDEVVLGHGTDRKSYCIERVVWGNDEEDWFARNYAETATPQRVNIEIKEIP